jgi:tripartite-type tricarboxylate transporter receptor subunit TctC
MTVQINRRQLVLGSVGAMLSPALLAQTNWPAGRHISWIVPYPPGGTTDVLGRSIAQRVGQALGTTVIVENKAGATGTIGGAMVAKAAPDGFTVLGTSIGPQSIVPHLMTKMSYYPLRDLEPVILIGTVPHVLVVPTSQAAPSVAALMAAAKAKPMAFASGGNGTILQMQAELLAQRTHLKFNHIPYKGDSPALMDTLGGQVDFMFAPITAALPYITSGKLKALAVTSAKRLKTLPNVPTMGESGFEGFVVEQWQAVYLPVGTPAAVVQRLNAEINKALVEPGIALLAERLGVTLVGGTPQHLAKVQKADSATWAEVIRNGNIKAD